VFQLALECYLKIDDDEQKTKPGTDQVGKPYELCG
jgi:hypothetical protein